MATPTSKEIGSAGGNDVGDWGEKDLKGLWARPFNIGGEPVSLDDTPPLGDGEQADADAKRSKARAPLRPR